MLDLIWPRRLRFAPLLFILAAGCEINTRLGGLPRDGGASPDMVVATDGGVGPDTAPVDRVPGDGGPPAEGGITPDARAPADTAAPADGAVTMDGGSADGQLLACASTNVPTVSPVPLRRLNNFEYNNTVRDLFADSSRPADSLPFDGYSNDATDTFIVATQVDGYHTLAHNYAITATKNAASVSAVAQCDPAVMGDAVCQQKFIAAFVPRVFRRPLDSSDATDFAAVFAKGRELGGSFATGVRAVIEVALQSPEFLYRVEFGQPVGAAQPSLARPTSYEMATRLSYLLWGSTPDSVLADAAAQDKLQTKEQIAVQARRLLADPHAHELVRYFYLQLLRLNGPGFLSNLEGTPDSPSFTTAELPGLFLKETSAFIDEVTWQGPGDFRTLLTAPFTFMNASLARFYGVSGIVGDTFQKVTLNANQRAGILTQAGFLASTSHSSMTSPTFRGKVVFEQILCGTLDPPPPNVSIVVPPPPTTGAVTTRQLLLQHLADPVCFSCHTDMDPLGFALENFDKLGLWRDTENGIAIDATGEIFKTDAKGRFNGPIELVQRLAQSRDVQSCYVKKWMVFGYGHEQTPADACSNEFLQNAFIQAKGNVRELLVALTQTDAFLYRPAP